MKIASIFIFALIALSSIQLSAARLIGLSRSDDDTQIVEYSFDATDVKVLQTLPIRTYSYYPNLAADASKQTLYFHGGDNTENPKTDQKFLFRVGADSQVGLAKIKLPDGFITGQTFPVTTTGSVYTLMALYSTENVGALSEYSMVLSKVDFDAGKFLPIATFDGWTNPFTVYDSDSGTVFLNAVQMPENKPIAVALDVQTGGQIPLPPTNPMKWTWMAKAWNPATQVVSIFGQHDPPLEFLSSNYTILSWNPFTGNLTANLPVFPLPSKVPQQTQPSLTAFDPKGPSFFLLYNSNLQWVDVFQVDVATAKPQRLSRFSGGFQRPVDIVVL